MTPVGQAEYERLVERAQQDEAIVGLVLTGSRGRDAFIREASDWDVRVVVRDDAFDDGVIRYATPHGSKVEVAVYRLSTFARLNEVGSDMGWDRYSYVHAKVVVDRLEGGFAQMVTAMAYLPPERARSLAAWDLDGYVNAYYRSLKNWWVGLEHEAHLDAAESVPLLLSALFAIPERVRPFNRFLGWELEHFPLPGDVWSAPVLLPRLQAILSAGDVGVQAALFRDMENHARSHGHGEVVDSWEPDLDWLRTGQSPRRAQGTDLPGE